MRLACRILKSRARKTGVRGRESQMTMEPHAARDIADPELRREADRFYGDRRNGAGLYAEVSPREEPRLLRFEPEDHDG